MARGLYSCRMSEAVTVNVRYDRLVVTPTYLLSGWNIVTNFDPDLLKTFIYIIHYIVNTFYVLF